ncbi:MAG: TolC family protein [Acidobacteria bacterium]|nr:TolC family protein [Acidobacteriota bacterium]
MKRHLGFIFLLFAAVGGYSQTPTPIPVPETVVVPPVAESFRSDDRDLPNLERVGVDAMDQRPLTKQEAIELALENNKDIEVARKTHSIAGWDLKAARGIYQPRLSGQTFYDHTTTPNVSIFSNNRTTTVGTLAGNAGVIAPLPRFGTIFSANLQSSRVTTDNPISILSPQENVALGFSLTQPLFRGRRFDAQRRTIEIAKRNYELTDTQFRQRSIESVAQVEKAYWDLTFALRNLQVQRDAVRDAKKQLEHNRRLVEEGQLAPIDIVAAETQVANFEQAVYDALNTVNLTENLLKNLIAPNRADNIWRQSLTPVDPVEQTVPTVTLADAIDDAMQNRPEIVLNNTQKEINKLDQRLYRDQKKPQIDLVASYASAGIGGGQNPHFSPIFPSACSTDPTSPACQQQQANMALLTGNPFTGVFANRYPTFRVGLNFNIPLFGDKTAAAQLGHAKVEAERIETQREQLEQGIQVEVRNALQAIRTAEARLRAAAIARENSERQYDSEQRKLDAGQSDVYRVLDRQTALTAAKSGELRARTELNKAIAEFERATGTTLKVNNIETKLHH